jgi:transcriptional regulator with XRE-family HTH domain
MPKTHPKPKSLTEARLSRLYRSQGAFAKRIGVSQQTLSKYESGVIVPDDERIAQIARALDMAKSEVAEFFA